MKDTYKEVRTFHYPNVIARVHIPDITPEERERRMANISKAAADLLLSIEQERNSNKV